MLLQELTEELRIAAGQSKPRTVFPGDLQDVIDHIVERDRALPIYISGYYDDGVLLVSTTPFDPKEFF